ncbi:MAG: hypothetical protein IPK14_08660 [Blastocatellia bacterium]|nr:hypothetical protein [Blastocatellia bacterium]MBL8193641.1 hypothetical protein [Blastocatellia bacterium]MBN8723749.1 hypothetical protein [Acidobacteriota bacterium]
MMEIILNCYRNLENEFYNFEAELSNFGLQILSKKAVNNVANNLELDKVELKINAQKGRQAKLVHELACKHFGRAYIFLSLAA